MGNVSSNNSNMFVTLHGVVVASSLPDATLVSSETNSNSSSKPLVFVDADNVSPTITTKRSFVPLKGNNGGSWANYNLELPKVVSTRPKRPIIHKIISKWSDNPNVVFNLHRDEPLITTQSTHINELTNQLIKNAFGPGSAAASFDQLPAILGQHYFNQHTTSIRPPPVANTIKILAKLPNPTKDEATKTNSNCKRIKIKLGNKNVNDFGSKEGCNDIDIEIDNKIENVNSVTTTNDYGNDKFQDSTNNDYSGEKQDDYGAITDVPQIINSITQIIQPSKNKGTTQGAFKGDDKEKEKKKKHKKKPNGVSASQIDDDGDDEDNGDSGTDVGGMMMTVMTMMAVFNPLNFGVWGIILAPMSAMLFGGICFAMYHFMQHPISKHPQWPSHPPWASDPWPKPQEIIIRNKINHSPIPIKVMHLHKHAPSPPKMYFSEPVESYGPPDMAYGPPMKSYGEPPSDSYHPSGPPLNGPYKRKANMRRPTKNKFTLL